MLLSLGVNLSFSFRKDEVSLDVQSFFSESQEQFAINFIHQLLKKDSWYSFNFHTQKLVSIINVVQMVDASQIVSDAFIVISYIPNISSLIDYW